MFIIVDPEVFEFGSSSLATGMRGSFLLCSSNGHGFFQIQVVYKLAVSHRPGGTQTPFELDFYHDICNLII